MPVFSTPQEFNVRMLRHLTLTLMLLLLIVSTAGAASLRLEFNDESAEAGFSAPLADDNLGKVVLGGRFIYNEDENTTRLGTLSLDFTGETGNVPGLTFGAGFFGSYGKTHQIFNTLNVGLGAMARYAPAELQGLGFSGHVALAPKIFSFKDSEGIYEWNAKVFYSLTPKVQIYGGYQFMRGRFENGSKLYFDRDFRAGLEAFF